MNLPSAADVSSMLTALSLLVASVASLVAAIVGLRNSRKIEVVRQATNGLKQELVAVTRAQALIEGHRDGRAAQKEEDAKNT